MPSITSERSQEVGVSGWSNALKIPVDSVVFVQLQRAGDMLEELAAGGEIGER
jgi:hypothetical protein